MSDFISFTPSPAPIQANPGKVSEDDKICLILNNVNNVSSHSPTVEYKVIYQCELKFNNAGTHISAIGQGPTMKNAHQEASKKILKILVKAEEQLAVQQQSQRKYPDEAYKFLNGQSDPVTKLQLLPNYLRNVAPPVYNEISIEGQSHQRTFTISCSFDDMVEHGTGNNKRSAKHNSASKIIGVIFRKLEEERSMNATAVKAKIVDLFKPPSPLGLGLNPTMKSMNNDDFQVIKVIGNAREVQTQTEKKQAEVQTQTKSKGIDQIGKRYESDTDSDDCDNTNQNECMNNESASCELIESDEEEVVKEKKGFDFDSLFNDQPLESVFSEIPKYSRTGVVQQEKSLLFKDLVTKMQKEDQVQENDNTIKRSKLMDQDDFDGNKKPKMLDCVPRNVSQNYNTELHSTRNNYGDIEEGKYQQGMREPQNKYKNYERKPGKGQRGWIP